MKYAGFRLNKIEAEKTEEKKSGNINVNSNFHLGEFKKEESSKDAKKPIYGFEFTYSVDYENTAKISFKGVIYIEIDSSEDKNLLKDLEKPGYKLSDNDLRKFILDVVLARTHVECLHLEERLGLPFHIQSPRVSFGSE